MLLHNAGGEGGGECVPHKHWAPIEALADAHVVLDAKFVLKKTLLFTSAGMKKHPGGLLLKEPAKKDLPMLFEMVSHSNWSR